MDASSSGNLILLLITLLVGLLSWVFNREVTRTNDRITANEARDDAQDRKLSNHAERLAIVDGNTERQ
jgi:hypothetical protein